jgi:putative sigma-54 modulation protein
MRLELTGRHIEISPALRRLVERKLARLERILKDAVVSAQVVLTSEKRTRRADVTLHARGEKFLHGIGVAEQWEASMTTAVDKIAQQAQRVKGKWQERKRRGTRGAAPPVPEAAEPVGGAARARTRQRMPHILRASRQAVKAMSLADAAREIEANGEGVIVFRDAETFAISVIYRRSTGELTLVETEA